MWIWLVVLLIIAGEIAAVYWWRRRRLPVPRWLFNTWAPAVYAALLLGAWVIGLLLSALFAGSDPGLAAAQGWLIALTVITAVALAAIAGVIFFLRWVLARDMSDVP